MIQTVTTVVFQAPDSSGRVPACRRLPEGVRIP
jgi:hypothetical protein